jgi:phenylalanyl-tRNA synthetase beta chain
VVEALFSTLGKDYSIKEAKHASLIEGRQASIVIAGQEIGFFGEIHPQVLNNFGIEEPVTAFEINISQAFLR